MGVVDHAGSQLYVADFFGVPNSHWVITRTTLCRPREVDKTRRQARDG